MKTTQITLLYALFFLAIACNSSAPESSENIETADPTQVVGELIEEAVETEEKEKVTCSDKLVNKYEPAADEEYISEEEFEDWERTCAYKSLKIVTKTECDYTGKCLETSVTLSKQNVKGQYIEIKNKEELFNDKKGELLSQINKAFKAEFNANIKDPEFIECYETSIYQNQNFKDIRITVSEYGFSFVSYYELLGYCNFNPGPLAFSLSLEEMEKYLKP
jgi:hypothetical protein